MLRCNLERYFAATFSVMAFLAITNISTVRANAQVAGATLSGTVTDPSGAAIAGARVSISNMATGVVRDATTSGLSLSHRYHAGIRLRTSEYFHWNGLAVFR
jgi:uncharacterized membrane protein